MVGRAVVVALELWLTREQLGPLGLGEQLVVECVLVCVTLRVEPASGIAVPVPGTAHSPAGFQ
jgi:hypothetical protein